MLRFLRGRMTVPITNGSVGQRRNYTITGLKRWSCQARQLPCMSLLLTCALFNAHFALAVSQVKAIHVYDFDNTCESIIPGVRF